MRILQVRFKNLNSLVGEWNIDFSHSEYVSNGIFAITGPTGAGKTTILDAICLALYGRTPRLDKVSKSENEIMSRQTAECFSEVTFETKEGRFRCTWSQRRARKKLDGELQNPSHEISDANTGHVLATKIREVADLVVEKTGMDFYRFTRSILLAQGGFAAFLQASPDERSPILEDITGTEIYSQISIRVHERQREEREKLDLLKAQTDSIMVLSPEEENGKKQQLLKVETEVADLLEKLEKTGKALDWLKKVNDLKKEIADFEVEAAELQNSFNNFQQERVKLDKALKAATLDGDYAAIDVIRHQQKSEKANLQNQEEKLPQLEKDFRNQSEALKEIQTQLKQKKESLQKTLPILNKVRLLDQTIREQTEQIAETKKAINDSSEKIAKTNRDKKTKQKKLEKAYEDRETIEDYLKEHDQDEQLVSLLTGIEEQLNGLTEKQREVSRLESEQKNAEKALKKEAKAFQKLQKESDTKKEELESASEKLKQARHELDQLLKGRFLREYRAEKESLIRESHFLKRIAELEEVRVQLEDGKPCPVCGATEHPYAKGNVPVPDEIDQKISELGKLIGKAEDQEVLIKNLEESENQARTHLSTKENQYRLSEQKQAMAKEALSAAAENFEKLQADFLLQKQNVSQKLLPFGIEAIPEEDISSCLDLLKKRLNAWQEQNEKSKKIETQIARIDSDIKQLDAVLKTQNETLEEKQNSLKALEKRHIQKSEERKELFGDKNPDQEESLLNQGISNEEKSENQARNQFDLLQQEINTVKGSIETLRKQIDQRIPELEKLEKAFVDAVTSIGFLNEEEFVKARLSSEERNVLMTKEKALKDREADLKTRQKDRNERLSALTQEKVTDQSLEDLELLLNGYKQSEIEARNTIAEIQHQLNENVSAQERIRIKQAEIEAQNREYSRWNNLHSLIGSADGKKYRNFAQGLTFEIMVQYANQQLSKMTDRYLLVRDESAPLELNIFDNYQAGEIRTTKNLSGGESFIVSLALALGLSRMSSKKVRVDSLFLDEGFGTLDENALDIALETLSSLRQEGKLIGVISHVSSLKERIGTQIVVEPLPGGKSQLSGPGVY